MRQRSTTGRVPNAAEVIREVMKQGVWTMKEYRIRLLAACVFLWTAAVPDLRSRRIPLWIPGAFLAAAAAADLLQPSGVSGWELWMGALPGAVLMALSVLLKGKLGEGDGLCLAVCGLFTGVTLAVMIMETAMVLAALTGGLCLCTGRWKAGDRIPFVPFIASAASLIMIAAAAAQ